MTKLKLADLKAKLFVWQVSTSSLINELAYCNGVMAKTSLTSGETKESQLKLTLKILVLDAGLFC